FARFGDIPAQSAPRLRPPTLSQVRRSMGPKQEIGGRMDSRPRSIRIRTTIKTSRRVCKPLWAVFETQRTRRSLRARQPDFSSAFSASSAFQKQPRCEFGETMKTSICLVIALLLSSAIHVFAQAQSHPPLRPLPEISKRQMDK